VVCLISGELAEKSCSVFGELVGRSINVVDNGSQRSPFFMYLRKSIQSWGSGSSRTQLFAYIFCENGFFKQVVHSVESVASLASRLYDGSSRREVIFCL
jgi:hypothetical protein